jgi:hypothetical protein
MLKQSVNIAAFEPSFSFQVRISRLKRSFGQPATNLTLLQSGRYASPRKPPVK